MDPLLSKFPPLNLKHRVVLAPLTRMRSTTPQVSKDDMRNNGARYDLSGLEATPAMAEYYGQRASEGGLLISEAVAVEPLGVGITNIPGMYTRRHSDSWIQVTNKVHQLHPSCKIFAQLWHTGRLSHSSYHGGKMTVSSSATPFPEPDKTKMPGYTLSRTQTPLGPLSHEPARPMNVDEIQEVIQHYGNASQFAKDAGFDGVSIHGAHGYLVEQFLSSSVNKRTDMYGGGNNISEVYQNRCRFLFEILEKVIAVWNNDTSCVGLRLSPSTSENSSQQGTQAYIMYGQTDDTKGAIYNYCIKEIAKRFPNLGYLLLTEPRWDPIAERRGAKDVNAGDANLAGAIAKKYRSLYPYTLMSAGGYSPNQAREMIENNHADLIGFGRWFISNPDLPERIKLNKPFTRYERKTFYGYNAEPGGDLGYLDYPDWKGSFGDASKLQTAIPQEYIELGSSLVAIDEAVSKL